MAPAEKREHSRHILSCHPKIWKIAGALVSLVLVALFFYMVKINAKLDEEGQQFQNDLETLRIEVGQFGTDTDHAESELEAMLAKLHGVETDLKRISSEEVDPAGIPQTHLVAQIWSFLTDLF